MNAFLLKKEERGIDVNKAILYSELGVQHAQKQYFQRTKRRPGTA